MPASSSSPEPTPGSPPDDVVVSMAPGRQQGDHPDPRRFASGRSLTHLVVRQEIRDWSRDTPAGPTTWRGDTIVYIAKLPLLGELRTI